MLRQPGHRLLFSSDEIELLSRNKKKKNPAIPSPRILVREIDNVFLLATMVSRVKQRSDYGAVCSRCALCKQDSMDGQYAACAGSRGLLINQYGVTLHERRTPLQLAAHYAPRLQAKASGLSGKS